MMRFRKSPKLEGAITTKPYPEQQMFILGKLLRLHYMRQEQLHYGCSSQVHELTGLSRNFSTMPDL